MGKTLTTALDQRAYRNALGNFATGVTVVTTCTKAGAYLGVTVNSFSSVSLEPPLVLFNLDRGTISLQGYREAGIFAVNVLRDTQLDISRRFAAGQSDKWSGIAHERWITGSPILKDAIARFDCQTEAVHEGGDHLIFVGRVLRFDYDPHAIPLVYFRSAYNSVSAQEGAGAPHAVRRAETDLAKTGPEEK